MAPRLLPAFGTSRSASCRSTRSARRPRPQVPGSRYGRRRSSQRAQYRPNVSFVCRTSPRSTCSMRRRRASPRGALTRKAALRGLRAVTAAIHEPPPDGVGRAIGVDAAAASVTSGVGTPRAGGDLRDRVVERARREPPTETDALADGPPRPANALPSRPDATGRSCVPTGCCQKVGTHVGICHVTTVPTPPDTNIRSLENEKSPACGAFPMRPRGLEPPRTNQSTRPSTLRVYQFRHRRVGWPV